MKYEPCSMTTRLKMNKTEMREYLTGKGFQISSPSQTSTSTIIKWDGIKAGYLLNDDVRLFDDTYIGTARLISVQYMHPRCLERVDRIILYLKTSELRRERRMRRERAELVRAYFNRRKNAVNEIEQFMLAELC